MGAKMLKALYQGPDWREGRKKIQAHRSHNVAPKKRRMNKMWPMRPRNSKDGRSWRQWRMDVKAALAKQKLASKRAIDKEKLSPREFREKYPRQEHHNYLFREAFESAGIKIPYVELERREGQAA